MRAVCGEIGPEDGVDPRELARAKAKQHFRAGGAPRGAGRKARQLGRQVAETLEAVFAGESRDEVLSGLRIVSVIPAPDASRLIVSVTPREALERLDPMDVSARLARAAGWLRAEVAGAVTRRKTPILTFRLIPADPDQISLESMKIVFTNDPPRAT